MATKEAIPDLDFVKGMTELRASALEHLKWSATDFHAVVGDRLETSAQSVERWMRSDGGHQGLPEPEFRNPILNCVREIVQSRYVVAPR